MEFHRFNYKTREDLISECEKINAPLKPAENYSVLSERIAQKGIIIPNRIAFQAMEGCDGNADGSPSDLTVRRYMRFSKSGAGFLYVEASAVDKSGRANPRQLMINENTADSYRRLVDEMRETAYKSRNPNPYITIQLTHSGRYSKDENGKPAPKAACFDPLRDDDEKIQVITDDELDVLREKFLTAAHFAAQCGFDSVDVKCCHGYLFAELAGARKREGKYGGSLENRTRLLREITAEIAKTEKLDVMVRLGAFDEYPYPFGFGVSEENPRVPDLTETKILCDALINGGVKILDITAGNPYYNPHVNRPYDCGTYIPAISQLEQIMKHLTSVKELKKHNPEAIYICSMMTWLRQFAPYIAAAGINEGWFDMVGFGRQSFAYPDFPNDILKNGGMKPEKCCVCCSKCTALMRAGQVAGCVVRDKIYTDIFKSLDNDKKMPPLNVPGEHL